ncbi:hypothetical protein ACLKA6_000167 [Drosophila palustris]
MSPRHTPSPRAERAVPPSPLTPAPPKSAPPPPLTSAPSTPPPPPPSKRNPYNNKDQVPSPGSSKDIPNCPRSNQDQVLSPGSDKDTRNSLGSNQDQVINPWITRDLSTVLAIARVLQHVLWPCGSKDASISPCKDQTISAILVDAGSVPAKEDITEEIECPELPELDGYVSDASTITRNLSAVCTRADQEVILDVASDDEDANQTVVEVISSDVP